MDWLDLVTPSAAILALFGVVAVIVVAIRQGRAIRRLEDRLASTGDAAEDAPLQRIAELQARQKISEGGTGGLRGELRTGLVVLASALVLVAAIGGVWYLFIRDDGDGGTAAGGATTEQATTQAGTTGNPPEPSDESLVPADPPAPSDPSAVAVMVWNATERNGFAGETATRIMGEGFTNVDTDDAPDAEKGRAESVVIWFRGNRDAARYIASVLSIKKAAVADGITQDQVGGDGVVVILGEDLANATGTGTTTTP
ncbi:MAG: LytR C-terminal domain-containing protein [Thermoleophilia bacterium]